MPKPMSGKAFSNLLDYYIACLTQEDMLSVTFNVSSEGKTFLSTPFHTEMLFHTNNNQASIQNSDETKRFFQTSWHRQKNKTLFYGYPVITGPLGTLSPLFFTELQSDQNNDQITLTNLSSHPRLNHYILMQHSFPAEEIKNIKQECEGESFSVALNSLCNILHYSPADCGVSLDVKPFKRTIKPTLINKAILYFGEQTEITHNLLVELNQLKNKPIDDLASTSLFILITSQYATGKTIQDIHPLLEIFSLNHAQEHAVVESLHKPLTVITGPPGTGKSQVVLNIIANAVYHKKTVLFASKNNKAVDVVIQKIQSILPYNLVVRMGHQAHRRNAQTQLEQLIRLPIEKIIIKQKNKNNLSSLKIRINRIQDFITQLKTHNERIDSLQKNYEALFDQLPNDFPVYDQTVQLENIDAVLFEEDFEKSFHRQNLLDHLHPSRSLQKQDKCFRKYYKAFPSALKIPLQNLLSEQKTTKKTVLQWILTIKKQEIIEAEIKRTKKSLCHIPDFKEMKNQLSNLHKEYIAVSQMFLKERWVNTFAQTTEQDKQHILIYFAASEQLHRGSIDETIFRQLHTQRLRAIQKTLQFLPVWVVTNLSAKQSLPLKNNLFDILIIDEASQCDIVSALPLFYRAKHLVIIGDPFQLKHISLLTESQDRQLATTHQVPEELFTKLSYTKHSLYDFAEEIKKKNNESPVLLNEHYRCHHDIIDFSNEYYYGRKLSIATDESRLLHHPTLQKRILWHQVKGKTVHAKSPYNEEEAERVVEETLRILKIAAETNASIGIVTLFRAQSELISEKLQKFKDLFENEITIGTAHKFQGDEKDIILFSPGISNDAKPGTLHWIQTTNQLLNVAVTRARSLFIIVGDQDTCRQTIGPLKNLSDYVEMTQTSVEDDDSHAKKILRDELKKQNVPVIPNYLLQSDVPYHIDFALFVNGKRYAIQLKEKKSDKTAKQFKENTWNIRWFTEKEILTNLPGVIEEIKRLC